MPKFGVCHDHNTWTAGRCVLSQESCDDRTETYKAPYETSLACSFPENVKVGRCTSSLDDKRCGPSEASCGTTSPYYDKIDPACSLVVDKTIDGERTTFPACSDLNEDVWQCVLDENSCITGERLKYAKWATEWGPHPCHCEDVPTGICYETRTTKDDTKNDNLTPDNSFCAVTARDCPSTYSWMSARAFLSSDRASYECRLCDDQAEKSESYSAGACLDSGASSTSITPSSLASCAMESIDCLSGSTEFVSSQRLLQQGMHCPIEQTKNWGYCTSAGDAVECTNKAGSCLYDFRFKVNDPDCDIHMNIKTGLPTYFSYCSPRTDNDDRDWKDIRCVWDEWECDPSKERWEEARLPNDAWFRGCTCEDVLTGVCQEPSTGDYYCAVSPNGCTNPDSYVPQRLLKDRGIDMSCRLCAPRPPSAAPTRFPSVPPVSPPTFLPVVVNRPTLPPIPWPTIPLLTQNPTWPTISPKLPTKSGAIESKQGSLSPGATAGVAIAGVVVCGLLVLIYTMATGVGTMKSSPVESYPEGNNNETEDPEVVIDHAQEMVPSASTIT